MWFAFLFAVISYSLLAIYADQCMSQTTYLNLERKQLHKLLIWVLPFLGALLIIWYCRSHQLGIDTHVKSNRKTNAGHFYESETGYHD